MKLTIAQANAVNELYDRPQTAKSHPELRRPEFFNNVMPMMGGGGAVIVPWCGMFLVVEPDGHTHS